jgi:exo-beta-1,3-glucanase (GH17 family)
LQKLPEGAAVTEKLVGTDVGVPDDGRDVGEAVTTQSNIKAAI